MTDQHEARDQREQFAMIGVRAFSYWRKGLPTKLTPSCFIVYTALVFRAHHHDRRCFPSLQTIADDTGVSRDTVSVAVRKLEEAGLISVEQRFNHRGQTSSVYTILEVTSAEKTGGPVGYPDSPVSEIPTHPHRKNRHELEPGEPEPNEPDSPSDGCAGNPDHSVSVDAGHQAAPATDPPAREKDHKHNGRGPGDVYALVDAYALAKGIKPHDVQGRQRKQAFDALKDLPAWVTPDAVRACVTYLLSDPFWREGGRLNSRNLPDKLLEWDANGRPEAMVPQNVRGGRRAVGGFSADDLRASAFEDFQKEAVS